MNKHRKSQFKKLIPGFWLTLLVCHSLDLAAGWSSPMVLLPPSVKKTLPGKSRESGTSQLGGPGGSGMRQKQDFIAWLWIGLGRGQQDQPRW